MLLCLNTSLGICIGTGCTHGLECKIMEFVVVIRVWELAKVFYGTSIISMILNFIQVLRILLQETVTKPAENAFY